MAVTLLYLAEQCKTISGVNDIQFILSLIKQSYSSAVKLNWYNNRNEGVYEVGGANIYTFKSITPVFDNDLDQYYIEIPSSFLDLPHSLGINNVSFMKSQGRPFIIISNGFLSLSSGQIWEGMENYMSCYIDGQRIYFPTMASLNVGDILLKMAVSLDDFDVDTPVNIPSDIQDVIITSVIQKLGINKKGE